MFEAENPRLGSYICPDSAEGLVVDQWKTAWQKNVRGRVGDERETLKDHSRGGIFSFITIPSHGNYQGPKRSTLSPSKGCATRGLTLPTSSQPLKVLPPQHSHLLLEDQTSSTTDDWKQLTDDFGKYVGSLLPCSKGLSHWYLDIKN